MFAKNKLIIGFLIMAVFLFTGCTQTKKQTGTENNAAPGAAGSRLNIVTTTTMLADLTKVIGGEQVTVNA